MRIKYGVKCKKKGAIDTEYRFDQDYWTGKNRFFYSINRAFDHCNYIINTFDNDAIVEELHKKD